jgi:hypothetical protein
MTNAPDPLDREIRGELERIPVPEDLQARIRASVARRRWLRRAGLAAAAVVAVVAALVLRPEADRPEPAAFVFDLSRDVETPLRIQEVRLAADVASSDGMLVFEFAEVEGGDDD